MMCMVGKYGRQIILLFAEDLEPRKLLNSPCEFTANFLLFFKDNDAVKILIVGINMKDQRSGKIVIVSHCILNVHCLEDNLAIYPGLEEEVVKLLIKKGVGIHQIPCPEMELSGIFRKALPKESYEHKKIRDGYHRLAEKIINTIIGYIKKEYEIVAVLGAEGSPTCGIEHVGKWKDHVKEKKEFPRDIEFVSGMGVFMEEFKSSLNNKNIHPKWLGIPGKSLRSIKSETFNLTLNELHNLL